MKKTFNDKLSITVLLAVKNESINLANCLQALDRVERIIIIDSKSEDNTCDIAKSYNAEIVQFNYTGGYPKKRQWAIENLNIQTRWTLLLDADEIVPNKLWNEMSTAISTPKPADAYMIKKKFHFLGRNIIMGGFSFYAVILFRTSKARFEKLLGNYGTDMDMEIHERVIVDGSISKLVTPLIHKDFKNLSKYIERHNYYSSWEANLRYNFFKTGHYGEDIIKPKFFGDSQERKRWLKILIMKLPFEHWFWFFYHYIICLGFINGRKGLIACQIRANYIQQVNAKVFEIKTTIKINNKNINK
jgi:glycosyltransferase involved in cell wall biosynthesis